MKAAQFRAHNEHPRIPIGIAERFRRAHGTDGRIASHKVQRYAMHCLRQSAFLHDLVIETGCIHAGAANGYEMRNITTTVPVTESIPDCLNAQSCGMPAKLFHPFSGRREGFRVVGVGEKSEVREVTVISENRMTVVNAAGPEYRAELSFLFRVEPHNLHHKIG